MKRKNLLLFTCLWLITGLASGQQKAISIDDYQTRKRTELRHATESIQQKTDFQTNQLKDAEIFLSEDFEGELFPPAGWSQIATHPSPTSNWQKVTEEENSFAQVLYNDAQMMDEWIISPSIDLSSMVSGFVSFRFFTSYYWLVDPFDGADLMLKVSTDGGTAWEQIWVEEDFGPFSTFVWYNVTLSFADYAGESDVKIAFHYLGNDGAQTRVDDITIFSSDVFELTMVDPIGEGNVIPAPGTYEFFEGTNVILAANPGLGYTFSNWNQGDVADINASITTIEMANNKTVQATFTEFGLDLLFHQYSYGGNANNSAVIDESTEYEVADNFSSTGIESITKVFVHGLTTGIGLNPQRPFTLRFYAPTKSGQPDWENPVSVQNITANAYYVEVLSWNPAYNVFKYELDLLEPVALQEGWISVQATDGGAFFWLSADEGSGDGDSWQRIVNADGDPNANLAYDFMLEVWGQEAEVAPNCVSYLSPADEAMNQPLNTSLSWQASPNATGYTLYFGETLPATGMDLGHVTSYDPVLAYSTTYLWKVVPYNSYGSALDCPVWSFTTGDDPTQFLPWSENFADITAGAIPSGWSRTHTNWGAVATANAGGTSPEMRFHWTPSATATFKLISPPLDPTTLGDCRLVFKHFINYYATGATYKVQTSADGETWTDIWSVIDPDANVGPETVIVSLGELNDTFYLAWVYDGNSFNTDGWFIDDIVVEEIPSLPVFNIAPDPLEGELDFGNVNIGELSAPVNFTVSNSGGGLITINTVTITGENADEFILTIDPEADYDLGAGETLTFNVVFAPDREGEKEALLAISYNDGSNNTYSIMLKGNGFDPTLTPPLLETFTGVDFPPPFWTRFSGILEENTTLVTGALWFHHKFGNITSDPNNSAYINLYGTKNHWLITPPIDLGSGGYQVEFDIALTPWSGTAQITMGPDDYVAFVISRDGGITWSNANVLIDWNEDDVILPTGNQIILDLSDETGVVKFGIYGERPTGNTPDLRFYFTNFQVRIPPVDPVFSINPDSWDFGEVEVGIESPLKDFVITNTGAGLLKIDPANITLDGEDQYAFNLYNLDEIVSLGPNESVIISLSFVPDEPRLFSIDLVIDDEVDVHLIPITGEGYERPAGSTCGNPYLLTLPVIDYVNNTEAYGDDYSSTWVAPITSYLNGNDFVAQFTLTEPGYLSGSVAGSWTGVIIVQDCPNPENPAQRLALGSGGSGGSFSNVLLTAGTYFAIVSTFPTPQFTQFTLNLSFEPLPDCPAPVGLTATGITSSSATLGWTAVGSETSWNVEWGLTGFTQGEGTLVDGVDNPYVLAGLDAATTYAFYVQAVCNGVTSDWAGPVTFTTQLVVPAPWFEGFATTTLPQGWTALPFWTIGTAPAIPPLDGNYIRRNLWSNATTGTITTINVGPVEQDMKLTFDYVLADWDAPHNPPAEGSGDFVVSVSTDFGVTYLEQVTIDNDGTEGWQHFSLDLAGFVGENVKIRIVANWYSGDYFIAFDNFYIGLPTTEGITLDLKVILEGAYSPDENELMHTQINDVLPLEQPFAPALPYFGNSDPIWYYEGDESVAVMPDNVVDWVLVELRDAAAPAEAYTSTVVARMAALLLNTGEIVTTNLSLPEFDIEITEGLYVVIYHRNHLAVMSAENLTEEDGVHYWDFTQAMDKAYRLQSRSSYGNGHKELGDGVFGMFGGDGDANGQVNVQDKNNVWSPESGSAGYNPGDFDLNGQVNVQDKNNIWNVNTGSGSVVPGDSK